MHGPKKMYSCLRILSIVAFAALLFPECAVSEHCFRNREPRGSLGTCDDEINLQGDSTKEACCEAGGEGWTDKANGKRCGDACDGVEQDQPDEEEVEEEEVVEEEPQEDDEERYCFRTRDARGALGSCEELIGVKKKEECCRYGGKGWTVKASGKRCEDTCLGVVDTGPVGHCFSTLRQKRNGNRCSNSVGEMGRIQCCQIGESGWSENSDGRRCVESCEQDPVDGGWSDWSDFAPCSVTCGEGNQTRSRTCDNPPPAHGGADCEGDATEVAICYEGKCPIDGNWGAWRRPGPCPETCQTEGSPVYRQQRRRCNNPAPAYGGKDCEGASLRRIRCDSLPFCPIHGNWSEWSEWSDCSVTCENGLRVKVRKCNNPEPQHGGNNCTGNDRLVTDCINRRKCPVDGGWSVWGSWSSCDAPRCGVDGTRIRSRTCTNPSPKYQGKYCEGHIIDKETCSVCPEWSEWGRWRPCSNGCKGNSVRERYRRCTGIGRCEGECVQTDGCADLDPCPDEDDGSGSGSGSGSGDDEIDNYAYDDIEECNEFGDDSYSEWEVPVDIGSVVYESEPEDPCDVYDYSLYDDCNRDPVFHVDPVVPVDPVGPIDSQAYPDSIDSSAYQNQESSEEESDSYSDYRVDDDDDESYDYSQYLV